MLLRHSLAAVACAATLANATPQVRDATDMWFDPAESGWGLNLIHQGETLFATLFVYGSDGNPRWFVASSLTGGASLQGSPSVYSGTLRECTGPSFAGPFNARPVDCRDVGPMRVEVGDTTAVLDYMVDSVRVVKQVQRFTFRAKTLAGSYEGYILQPAVGGTGEVRKDDLPSSSTTTGRRSSWTAPAIPRALARGAGRTVTTARRKASTAPTNAPRDPGRGR